MSEMQPPFPARSVPQFSGHECLPRCMLGRERRVCWVLKWSGVDYRRYPLETGWPGLFFSSIIGCCGDFKWHFNKY